MAVTTPLSPLSPAAVRLHGGFWGPKIDTVRNTTLPLQYTMLKQTGRYGAYTWEPGARHAPHIFWDSDVAKWIEAGAYALMSRPDRVLERRIDTYVEGLAQKQSADGYLNSHFLLVEPAKRWTNLRDNHELYTAGHLIEAAVAYHAATGKRALLDIIRRFADHIDRTFGRSKGKRRGYCGHEEIELALVKLYRSTGERRYLNLATYFIDERGRNPNYFDLEARARGDDPAKFWAGGHDYLQAHAPVREQRDAVGHAVRAMYLYAGMADVATETADASLSAACRRVWDSVTERRLYITGGIGSSRQGERFTYDYDLPNESAYAETCAAIGLVFFAQRMLNRHRDSRYADTLETALYNGVLSGISLDGTRFFYENPLAAYPEETRAQGYNQGTGGVGRHEWFGCACCPPNIARLFMSLGSYVYSTDTRSIWVHLFVNGTAEAMVGEQRVLLDQQTDYPWNETTSIAVTPERPTTFTVSVRIPGWCRRPALAINGASVSLSRVVKNGYAILHRTWKPGDRITLTLPMSVERIEAHPSVRQDCGRVALRRGPIVYCLEEADNGRDLHDICLTSGTRPTPRFDPVLLGGVVTLSGSGVRRATGGWARTLYRPQSHATRGASVKAVPYYAWANRGQGEMVVWMGGR